MSTDDKVTAVTGATAGAAAGPSLWRSRGLLLAVGDFLIVFLCFLAAYFIRFHLQFLALKRISPQDVDLYLSAGLTMATLWVALLWHGGGYAVGLRGVVEPVERVKLLLTTGAQAMAMLLVVGYLARLMISRQACLMGGALALGMLLLVRWLLHELDRDLAAQGRVVQRIVVAGYPAEGDGFAERLAKVGGTVQVVGFVPLPAATDPAAAPPLPVLLRRLRELFQTRPFDKLVLTPSVLATAADPAAAAAMVELLNFCEAENIGLFSLPQTMNVAVRGSEIGAVAGMPIVQLRDAALHPAYAAVKRVMDLVLAATVLLLGLPLWLGLALLIKLTSPGPVLFAQWRIGTHGRRFRIYKFRSMVVDAEDRLKDLVKLDELAVPGFKLKNDPRVTAIGKFLRRSSLDEMPQVLNVLKGEMSLVGPRPELPDLVDRYDAWQRRRLKAKPGITGYQQVMARGTPLAAAMEYDLIYLKNQSLLFDLYIMAKTVQVVLLGRGVTH